MLVNINETIFHKNKTA